MLRFFSLSVFLVSMLGAPLLAQHTVHKTKKAIATNPTVRWVILRADTAGLLHAVQGQIAKAQAEGRTPFLEFGATWCGPCQALEASLRNKDIIDAFSGAYIIHIDADTWNLMLNPDQMRQLSDKPLGGMAMPVIMAINKEGKIVDKLQQGIKAIDIKPFLQAHTWRAALPSDSSGDAMPSGRSR